MSEDKVLGLESLAPAPGARHRRKRKGIGEGSGNGKTSGKGQKGQKSRSGASIPRGFEGGQMPMHRRLPKVGFTSRQRVLGKNIYTVLSVELLESLGIDGEITLDELKARGLVKGRNAKVKILGGSAVSSKIVVEAHKASASAKSAIEAAGGEIRLV
jgi:large subunit ribosomal protein L15